MRPVHTGIFSCMSSVQQGFLVLKCEKQQRVKLISHLEYHISTFPKCRHSGQVRQFSPTCYPSFPISGSTSDSTFNCAIRGWVNAALSDFPMCDLLGYISDPWILYYSCVLPQNATNMQSYSHPRKLRLPQIGDAACVPCLPTNHTELNWVSEIECISRYQYWKEGNIIFSGFTCTYPYLHLNQ